MIFKFHDHLPEELKTKYFDFIPNDYPNDKFCKDLLEQIKSSYNNCRYYKESLCKNFNFTIPEDLPFEDLEKIPYLPTDIYKKSEERTMQLLKVPLDKITLFSCSSSTSGDPSIVPRILGDFDQLQYNSIKVFSESLNGRIIKLVLKEVLF